MRTKISLIQPRHVYAPNPEIESLGHINMPTSLLSAASVLLNAGVEVSILDENIETHSFESRLMGINLVGAPYIPTAIEYVNSLRNRYRDDFFLIMGGQVVAGLSAPQIRKLFGPNVSSGNKFEKLAANLKLDCTFSRITDMSLIPAYLKLSDHYMNLYLANEFSFYLSQGCKYSCSFCAAQRSIRDPITSKWIRMKENYRNLDVVCGDLDYLVTKAQALRIDSLNLYLSNLDLFQTPLLLNKFAEKVVQIKKNHNEFQINLRGLSTVRSFLHIHKSNPAIIRNLLAAGLYRIGFGIDGAAPKIWKETRKPQTKSECIEAIAVARNVYDLTPETLMVFGYNKCEDEETLQLAYEFTKDMYDSYMALPRPHVSKEIIPGNDGWTDKKNQETINYLISNPILFQNLDFTALASPFTHPNDRFREVVNKYFLKMCNLPASLTQYIKPENSNMSKKELSAVRKFNLKKYDI